MHINLTPATVTTEKISEGLGNELGRLNELL
jgi:hypothetical protein